MNTDENIRNYIITVSSEILLKSRRSRPKFFRRLIRNLRDALERKGLNECIINQEGAKLFVKCHKDALSLLSKVFGVYRVGEVLEVEFRDLGELSVKISHLAEDLVRGKKFAVRVHRVGDHSFTSVDAEREIGSALYPYSSGVNLSNPEVVVWVEIRGWRAYLYRSRIKGVGGLPIGVDGRALSLYSGGFDSPIAAWYVARRGVEVDFLHFFLGDTQSTYLAVESARRLANEWLYGYRPKALIIDFTGVVSSIIRGVRRSYRQVVLRALMYSAASEIAGRFGYEALVTGEVIGQASSQTLYNLRAAEAVSKIGIPILRPLLGMDKEEVIRTSRMLEMYEISSRVREPCMLAPTLVATKASIKDLAAELGRVDREELSKALGRVKVLEDLLSSDPIDALPDDCVDIDFIPPNSLLIDARSKEEWLRDGIKGSVHVSEVKDLESLKGKTVVIYCSKGVRSYLLAKELRSKGVKAFSLRRAGEGKY